MYFEQDRKVGILLILIGLGFTVFGIIFLMDKGFLALGNMAITIGIGYFVGFKNYGKFLFKDGLSSAAAIGYCLGLLLILKGHIYTGLIIESTSFLCLFKPIARVIMSILEMVPGIGSILAAVRKS